MSFILLSAIKCRKKLPKPVVRFPLVACVKNYALYFTPPPHTHNLALTLFKVPPEGQGREESNTWLDRISVWSKHNDKKKETEMIEKLDSAANLGRRSSSKAGKRGDENLKESHPSQSPFRRLSMPLGSCDDASSLLSLSEDRPSYCPRFVTCKMWINQFQEAKPNWLIAWTSAAATISVGNVYIFGLKVKVYCADTFCTSDTNGTGVASGHA